MKRIKLFASCGIFLAITLVKLLIPGAAYAIRAGAAEIVGHDTDYTPVINFINARVSGTGESEQTIIDISGEKEQTSREISYKPVTIDELREKTASVLREPKANAEAEAEALTAEQQVEKAETPDDVSDVEPEAVTAFFESQAEYSEYAVPANVTYSMEDIPFEYCRPVSGYHSSGFGYRLHPIANEIKFHYGTDFAANSGDSIFAFASGTVGFAGYSESYGNYVVIAHGDGWQTLYAHCSKLYVSSGESVSKGQEIALVGETGQATGPHLHLELTHNGVYINPEYYVNSI